MKTIQEIELRSRIMSNLAPYLSADAAAQEYAQILFTALQDWTLPQRPATVSDSPDVTQLTESNFQSWIQAEGIAVVKVWASHCPSCLTYAQAFSEAAKLEGFRFGSFELPKAHSKFRLQYMRAVNGKPPMIPLTILFRDGMEITRSVGPMTAQQLRELVHYHGVPST